MATNPATPRDGCLVTAEPFAELVRVYVVRWNKERPQPGGAFGSQDEIPPIQALAWLVAESGIPRGTLERLLTKGDRAHHVIELRVADAISLALDAPYIWSDERIRVEPNPHASESARAECCPGSTRQYAVAV